VQPVAGDDLAGVASAVDDLTPDFQPNLHRYIVPMNCAPTMPLPAGVMLHDMSGYTLA
jgi:hypothetical protein